MLTFFAAVLLVLKSIELVLRCLQEVSSETEFIRILGSNLQDFVMDLVCLWVEKAVPNEEVDLERFRGLLEPIQEFESRLNEIGNYVA